MTFGIFNSKKIESTTGNIHRGRAIGLFVLGCVMVLFTSLENIFFLYVQNLKVLFRISHTAVEIMSASFLMGFFLVLPFNWVYERFGFYGSVIVGFFLCGGGMLLTGIAASMPESFVSMSFLVAIFQFMISHGRSHLYYLAVHVTVTVTPDKHRGKAVGLLVSLVVVGQIIFSYMYQEFFPSQASVSSFFFFAFSVTAMSTTVYVTFYAITDRWTRDSGNDVTPLLEAQTEKYNTFDSREIISDVNDEQFKYQRKNNEQTAPKFTGVDFKNENNLYKSYMKNDKYAKNMKNFCDQYIPKNKKAKCKILENNAEKENNFQLEEKEQTEFSRIRNMFEKAEREKKSIYSEIKRSPSPQKNTEEKPNTQAKRDETNCREIFQTNDNQDCLSHSGDINKTSQETRPLTENCMHTKCAKSVIESERSDTNEKGLEECLKEDRRNDQHGESTQNDSTHLNTELCKDSAKETNDHKSSNEIEVKKNEIPNTASVFRGQIREQMTKDRLKGRRDEDSSFSKRDSNEDLSRTVSQSDKSCSDKIPLLPRESVKEESTKNTKTNVDVGGEKELILANVEAQERYKFREILKDKSFHLFLWSGGTIIFCAFLYMNNIILVLTTVGLESLSNSMIALNLSVTLVLRLLTGYAYDVLDSNFYRMLMLAGAAMCNVASFLLTAIWMDSQVVLYISVMANGISMGISMTTCIAHCSKILGFANKGRVQAILLTLVGVALFVSSVFIGVMYDTMILDNETDEYNCYGPLCYQTTYIFFSSLNALATVLLCVLLKMSLTKKPKESTEIDVKPESWSSKLTKNNVERGSEGLCR